MRSVFAGLMFISAPILANPYDPMIDAAAYRHGIDPIVLRAVVQAETQKKPWAFNCDGEGFYFDSKDAAIMALWQISQNPWLVKIVMKGEVIRQFFPSSARAQYFLNAYRAAQQRTGRAAAVVRVDSGKSVDEGQARIRQLWVVNTDIGIAQVNYRFHGVTRARVQQWFDPPYNLDYAASLIAAQKRNRRSDLEAAGDYHSKTPNERGVYMKRLIPIYQSEKASAVTSFATK
ncbi:hypothetical protein [Pseudomonas sp. MWU12-2323]|uniref:hypothetical protein n=1 Tax=Pseudomonas sp. MWU12-2323 TaxID=2651296 RepID=UPI00128C6D66|nr:hypothetical protein [Pseudomonas sp. MWU12-2323]MPQ69407.1 hypothetical protein [Pseudomonas sp. MWU12-2323]